jgi:predicted phage terminase large subunit-like protein
MTIQTIRPQKGQQHSFVVADEDLILYGGSAGGGKSYGILIRALRFVDDPNFYCGFFRKTLNQLELGLWKDALEMVYPLLVYPQGHAKAGKFKGKAKVLLAKHIIIFPSGAVWRFGYLDNDQAVVFNYQGAQFSAIFIDEATHATPFQINYLRTRLRSKAKNKAFMCLTMNPDQDHYVYQFVQPYLDEDGFPKRSLSGKKRYYIFVSGVVHTDWDKAKLKKEYPEQNPREYTFIPSLLTDNPALIEAEPDYADNLQANNPAEVEALLKGGWHYRPNTGTHFQRAWCQMVNEMPRDANRARAWDLASSEPTAEYRNPDYTAGIRVARASDGYFYIETGKRFRKRAGERDRLMMNLAQKDGDDVGVVIPRDSGAGGKAQAEDLSRKFVTAGFTCKQIPAGNAKGMKVKRFAPFSSAAENGLVKIVTSGWDTQEELEDFLGELEAFTGDGKGHDDMVDAVADCFNHLSETRYIPSFTPWSESKVNEFKQ